MFLVVVFIFFFFSPLVIFNEELSLLGSQGSRHQSFPLGVRWENLCSRVELGCLFRYFLYTAESSKTTFIGSSCPVFYHLDVENTVQISHTSPFDNSPFSSDEPYKSVVGPRPGKALITVEAQSSTPPTPIRLPSVKVPVKVLCGWFS